MSLILLSSSDQSLAKLLPFIFKYLCKSESYFHNFLHLCCEVMDALFTLSSAGSWQSAEIQESGGLKPLVVNKITYILETGTMC